jgi:hypothetical protein
MFYFVKSTLCFDVLPKVMKIFDEQLSIFVEAWDHM